MDPLKSGNHRPASEIPFKCRFAGVPMMAPPLNAGWVAIVIFQRIRASIAKKPYILCFFRGGGGGGGTDPLSRPLDLHMEMNNLKQ